MTLAPRCDIHDTGQTTIPVIETQMTSTQFFLRVLRLLRGSIHTSPPPSTQELP